MRQFEPLHVHFVCTGNAARSVMTAAMTKAWAPALVVSSSGTHSIDGQPISVRTREALASLGLEAREHRSAQLYEWTLDGVDLVVAMAVEHVSYIRRRHPEAAARTATLKRLVRDLPGTPAGPLPERLDALALAEVELEAWEDVLDPAGGQVDDFKACARELSDLVQVLLAELAELSPDAELSAGDELSELATDPPPNGQRPG
jgi:protein-tyrosine-phosphatase